MAQFPLSPNPHGKDFGWRTPSYGGVKGEDGTSGTNGQAREPTRGHTNLATFQFNADWVEKLDKSPYFAVYGIKLTLQRDEG
jgi:hypothetical protein